MHPTRASPPPKGEHKQDRLGGAPAEREALHSRLPRTARLHARLTAARRAALPRAAPLTTQLLPGCECRQGIRHPVHPTVGQIRHDERDPALVEGERRVETANRRLHLVHRAARRPTLLEWPRSGRKRFSLKYPMSASR
eukprot:81803-Prymnesium_polylepis.1